MSQWSEFVIRLLESGYILPAEAFGEIEDRIAALEAKQEHQSVRGLPPSNITIPMPECKPPSQSADARVAELEALISAMIPVVQAVRENVTFNRPIAENIRKAYEVYSNA